MPRPIKYATVGSHSLSASASVSGALVTDGTAGSVTPIGRCRLVSLECAVSGGTVGVNTAVTLIYLAKDAAGLHPITNPGNEARTGMADSNVSGFAVRLEQDAYIEGPVYAVAKMATGKSGTGVWRLTFVQGG